MSHYIRRRQSYSGGMIAFENPAQDELLRSLSYCCVDSMYHVKFYLGPEGDRDISAEQALITDLRERVLQANIKHNGVSPTIEGGEVSLQGTVFFSVWHCGSVDLEDMVEIGNRIEGVDARWAWPQLTALKEQAGLSAPDFPYMDRDFKERRDCLPSWYKGAWMSAKGGALRVDAALPDIYLERLKAGMIQKGAVFEGRQESADTRREHELRFKWMIAQKGISGTKEAIHQGLRGFVADYSC